MSYLLTVLLAAALAAPVWAAAAAGPSPTTSPAEGGAGVYRPGPDGLDYPDFTYAGIRGGIPQVDGPIFNVVQHGAKADDAQSDHAAIASAVAQAAKAGGGVVYLPNGTYELDDVIAVGSDNIVIRGQSRDRTILKLNAGGGGKDYYGANAVVFFKGKMKIDFVDRRLAAPARAGDMVLKMADHDYKPGEFLMYSGKLMSLVMRVEKVDGSAVTVNQPLRMDLPIEDGQFRRYGVIRRVGVENLTLETTRDMNSNGVGFYGVWEGWVRDCTIRKAGRFPIGYNNARYLEIRNCLFEETWKHGGGGVGYCGFWACWDSLMDNCEGRQLRHAPNLQDQAQGCVIRNCRFDQSDLQWHTGGASFNLIENVTVTLDSTRPGFHSAQLLRTSRPGIDTIHSPAGPGNVVYYSDFRCTQGNVSGADFGHEMRHWVFSYNRVVAPGSGEGLLRIWYDHAEDFVFKGNVLATSNARKGGGIRLIAADPAKASGRGVKFIGNRMCGWSPADGAWWTGPVKPDVDQDNTLSEVFAEPQRPAPPVGADGKPVTSLYAWQMKNRYGLDVDRPRTAEKTARSAEDDTWPVEPSR